MWAQHDMIHTWDLSSVPTISQQPGQPRSPQAEDPLFSLSFNVALSTQIKPHDAFGQQMLRNLQVRHPASPCLAP